MQRVFSNLYWQCGADSDCTGSTNGKKCVGGQCLCGTNSECSGTTPFCGSAATTEATAADASPTCYVRKYFIFWLPIVLLNLVKDDYYGNRNSIFPFSVRQIHARIVIPINAIPPLEYANVIQSQNARGKRNTASIRYQKGLRKKASLQGLRIMTGSQHVGWVYLLFFQRTPIQ